MIRAMLDLSSSHRSPETHAWLDQQLADDRAPVHPPDRTTGRPSDLSPVRHATRPTPKEAAMPPRKTATVHDHTDDAIRRAGTIGALERLAGIEPTPAARDAFWRPFAHQPGAEGLDAGIAELKRRIQTATRAAAPVQHRTQNNA